MKSKTIITTKIKFTVPGTLRRIACVVFVASTIANSALGALPERGGKAKPDAGISSVTLKAGRASATRLLAKMKENVSDDIGITTALEKGAWKEGARSRVVPGLTVLHLKGDVGVLSSVALETEMARLMATGLFEYVEPDWEVKLLTTPSDSAFTSGELWGLQNTGQNGGVPGIDVNAVEAWKVTTGKSSVVVGIVDTGIRYTHQDLRGNMWTNTGEIAGNRRDDDGNGYVDDIHGINAYTGSGDPMDDNGHGSHVAGTIGATADDQGQHVGVAHGIRLMGLKFLTSGGWGYNSDAIECIDYAVAHGVDILNNSWGGGGFSQALLEAIEAANDAGVLFVAAAGNSGLNTDWNPHYPSSYDVPNVISVAAIDRTGSLAYFSNYGSSTVDLGAPGMSILSCSASSDWGYTTYDGTSMASPHVAGVAALVASQSPGISVTDMRSRLLSSVAILSDLEGSTVTGGMVDAGAAMGVGGGIPDTWSQWYELADSYFSYYASMGDYAVAQGYYEYFRGMGDSEFHIAHGRIPEADFVYNAGLGKCFYYIYSGYGMQSWAVTYYYYYYALAYYHYFMGYGDSSTAEYCYNYFMSLAFGG